MLKRFTKYYKPHLKLFICDMIASFLMSISGIFYPMITRSMLNDFIPNKKIMVLVIWGIGLLVIYLFRMLMRYFVSYYGHIIGVKMQAAMRLDLFKHLEKLPFSYYDDHETGHIMSRMINDLMDISELAHHGPENLFISGFMIIASFIYLCTINVILTLIIFICVPILFVFSLKMRKKMQDSFMESRKEIAVINANLENSISGIRVTKAFTNDNYEEEKFEVGNQRFVKARSKAYKAMATFFAGNAFIVDFFNVVVLVGGGLFTYYGIIDYADLATYMISVNLFISPVTTLINFIEQYQNGKTGFMRYIEIMDEKVEEVNPSAISLDSVKGDISFENVNFTYQNGEKVLQNISLDIESGETLALVGPSGGGKTTICHLIPRFYNLDSGFIKIDNIKIQDIKYESLRKHIGIVQQDVFLFTGTIRENIAYGKLDATDEEIIEAAKNANIHDYVMALPDGYDTNIGERGIRLSGGQKQRLSIARVFLKNPSILILDEATSSLDNTTEIFIQKALDNLCKGRTTIVVAHRLSTIKNADEIAVISRGEIIEKGSHEELIEKNGIYKKLYEAQFNREKLDGELFG